MVKGRSEIGAEIVKSRSEIGAKWFVIPLVNAYNIGDGGHDLWKKCTLEEK